MLDMVLGKGNPLRKKKTFQDQWDRFSDYKTDSRFKNFSSMNKDAYNLISTISKYTKDKSFNILSPRIFSLMPQKEARVVNRVSSQDNILKGFSLTEYFSILQRRLWE